MQPAGSAKDARRRPKASHAGRSIPGSVGGGREGGRGARRCRPNSLP
ncbi:hypothetical protein QCF19_14285 [Staphylococcus aureus]|nr:hypothetical protein [Staphylococcus aureus]